MSSAKLLTKVQRQMDIQMKRYTFSGEDLISVLKFLTIFRSSFETNGLHEIAFMWCSQFYFTGKAYFLVQPRLTGEKVIVDDHRTKVLMMYPEVVNLLLKGYVTDEVIADADADITS